jgi:hypothetical protein
MKFQYRIFFLKINFTNRAGTFPPHEGGQTLKESLEHIKSVREVIMNTETSQVERVQRMIQYCTEEMVLVETELAAGIATIEHQRKVIDQQNNLLEAIFQMVGKELGKL